MNIPDDYLTIRGHRPHQPPYRWWRSHRWRSGLANVCAALLILTGVLFWLLVLTGHEGAVDILKTIYAGGGR